MYLSFQALVHASWEPLQSWCSVSQDSAAFHAVVFRIKFEKKSISYIQCIWMLGHQERIAHLLVLPVLLALCSPRPVALSLKSVPLVCLYLFIHVCRGPLLSSCSIIHQHLLVAHSAPTAQPFLLVTLTEFRMRLGGWRS